MWVHLSWSAPFLRQTSALHVPWILQLMLRVGTSTVHVTSVSVLGVHRLSNILSYEAFFEFIVLTE